MRPALGGAARNATTAADVPRYTQGGVPRRRPAPSAGRVVVCEETGGLLRDGRCAFFEGDPKKTCEKCAGTWAAHHS